MGRYNSLIVASVKLAFVFFKRGISRGKRKSVKPDRPPANNISLSFIIGVVSVNLLEINPIPPSSLKRSMYGFFTFTSTTEAIRPP